MTKMRQRHQGCSDSSRQMALIFCRLQPRFIQRLRQDSWLCYVHGNTLLFVSFHCLHLWQVDYSKSAPRFLLPSKLLTVESCFIISLHVRFACRNRTMEFCFKMLPSKSSRVGFGQKVETFLRLCHFHSWIFRFLGLKISTFVSHIRSQYT